MKMRKIKKGELVILTSGCYSDYGVTSMCRATDNFSPDDLRDKWLALHPEQAGDYSFENYEFAAWVINELKLLEEISFIDWHLANYFNASEMHCDEGEPGLTWLNKFKKSS